MNRFQTRLVFLSCTVINQYFYWGVFFSGSFSNSASSHGLLCSKADSTYSCHGEMCVWIPILIIWGILILYILCKTPSKHSLQWFKFFQYPVSCWLQQVNVWFLAAFDRHHAKCEHSILGVWSQEMVQKHSYSRSQKCGIGAWLLL